MDARSAASLRAIAAAVQSAVQTVTEALDRADDYDELRDAIRGAQSSLGRGTAQVATLEREWSPHARVVRIGRRAVERTELALRAVLEALEAKEDNLRRTALDAALRGAERAAKAILVDTDGPDAFRAAG